MLREEERAGDYGGTENTYVTTIEDLDIGDEPQRRQERQDLEAIWRLTSEYVSLTAPRMRAGIPLADFVPSPSKLIDISQITNPADVSPKTDQKQVETNMDQTAKDYQRFFDDTFPRRPHSSGRPAIKENTFLPPGGSRAKGRPEGEPDQRWLQETVLRNPEDNGWGYKHAAREEGDAPSSSGAAKALRDVAV